MTRAAQLPPVLPRSRPALPPLQNGDNLTAAEFERRYEAMAPGTRAELIEGVVYMFPPVSLGWHGRPHFKWVTVLGVYEGATAGVIGGDNASIRLGLGNMPQPDVCLLIHPSLGGRAAIDADGYVTGGPELVAEVAATTANYDLHQKLELYRRNGVLEYLVWRTLDEQFDQFALRDGRYDRVLPGADGLVRSTAFPGLWLNTAALVAGDTPAALADLHRGLASPEHAAFVADLRRRASANG